VLFHHSTKFGAKRSRNYGPISKSMMAAVRHLGFVTSSFRTTHEVFFIGPHRRVKFYANLMHSFEDMTIWIFCRFGLKCPITRPKFWFFGESEPLNVIGHHREPQKAHPWSKSHLHANFGADRSIGATWARAEGIKKKKRKKQGKKLYPAPFCHLTLASGLYNSLYYRTSRDESKMAVPFSSLNSYY